MPKPILHDFRDPREQAVIPPVTQASIQQAKDAADRERAHVAAQIAAFKAEQLTGEQMAVLDAQDAIERLADSLGSYRRLAILVRNIAHIHGEEV